MDLSLVSIDEIFEELDKRFDTVVVLTIKERNDRELFEFHHKGSFMAAIGLCESYAFAAKDQKELEETDGFNVD